MAALQTQQELARKTLQRGMDDCRKTEAFLEACLQAREQLLGGELVFGPCRICAYAGASTGDWGGCARAYDALC